MHCTELYPSNFILFRILLSQDFVSRGQLFCVWVHVLMRLIKWFLSKICYCPFVLLIIKGRETSHLAPRRSMKHQALFPFSTQIIPKRLEQVGAITSSLCKKALDGMLFYVYFMNSIPVLVVSFFFIIMNSKDLPKVNLVWLHWLNSKETIFSSHDNGTFIEPNCLCL